jgi:hypothetical protein
VGKADRQGGKEKRPGSRGKPDGNCGNEEEARRERREGYSNRIGGFA